MTRFIDICPVCEDRATAAWRAERDGREHNDNPPAWVPPIREWQAHRRHDEYDFRNYDVLAGTSAPDQSAQCDWCLVPILGSFTTYRCDSD